MGIFINDDFGNFWLAGVENMNEKGLREQIDFYTERGGVEAILFNMNASRAYYDSKVFTPIWKDVEFREDGKLFYLGNEVIDHPVEPNMKTMTICAYALHKNHGNPMKFRYKYCHERGVEMWHSMRMNDAHWMPQEELNQHSDFWREHPEFRRAYYRKTLNGTWANQALDYMHEEVRDYIMNMILEYLSFECDGIELDFLRTLPLCRQGFEEFCRPLITEMMRKIRKVANAAAEKYGHRVRILVRIPPTPEENLLQGLDVFTWMKEGLVDIVVPSPVQPASMSDIPVDLWKLLLPENIILAPGIEIGVGSGYGERMRATRETDAGFAAGFYYLGADTIYFYNHFPYPYKEKQMQETFGFIGNRAETEKRPRRHVATYGETQLDGRAIVRTFPPLAYAKSSINLNRNVGGGTANREARVIILGDRPFSASILLNTEKCEFLPDAPLPGAMPKGNLFPAVFRVPNGVLHDGLNGIDVINLTEESFELRWVEIDLL